MALKDTSSIKPERIKRIFLALNQAWENDFNMGSASLRKQAKAEFTENYPQLAAVIPQIIDLLDDLTPNH